MRTLFVDLETASAIPIKNGIYKYCEDVRILLLACAWDDEPVQVHEWGRGSYLQLLDMIEQADEVVVHGGEFDFVVLDHFNLAPPLEKRYCTMAQARRHGLPGELLKLCEIFRVPVDLAKSDRGKYLIRLFCVPQKDGRWFDKTTHPTQWEEFKFYAGTDITSMRYLRRVMPTWNDAVERPIWELDHESNKRGFAVDTQLAWSAVELLSESKSNLDNLVSTVTDGEVTKGTQRDRILGHILKAYGVDLPDLRASTIERRLLDESLPDGVRGLLSIRQQSAKTSTSKYATMLRCVNADNRLRGVKVYCGASRTGRWSAQRFQSDNMPRPTIPSSELLHGIKCIRSQFTAGLDPEIGLGKYASEGIRGLLVASPGRKLLVADYSNIEGRFTAWLADEQWKLDAFAAYDAGKGPDTYKVAYAKLFGVEPKDVAGLQRQIGKVVELMLGYGGSVSAFLTGAALYRIDLNELAEKAWPVIPRGIQCDAELAWIKALMAGQTFDLTQAVYCTCWGLSRLWRRENKDIANMWNKLTEAARTTIASGKPTTVGKLSFDKVGAWLRMLLPSGRYLCYPSAKIDEDGNIQFRGVNNYTKQWSWIYTWGGTFLENASQGCARDVLCDGMLEAEAVDLPVVLHIHDEPICDVSQDRTIDELIGCMIKGWEWTQGLPLAAKGLECERYYKAD